MSIYHSKALFSFYLIAIFCIITFLTNAQQVKNVPLAFKALSSDPQESVVRNEIDVPKEGGHLQGVQVLTLKGREKLLISGSSLSKAYILQADITTNKTEKLITLMGQPFRHAGGFQVSKQYLAVGIEDNHTKTISKVCVYNYNNESLPDAQPLFVITREGEPKKQTAGSTGLLALENSYLMVVSNWDSRNWDFYTFNLEKKNPKIIESFTAPDSWPSYQSINLIKDKEAIYAVGFYQKEQSCRADLVLISKIGAFDPIMDLVSTKSFNCTNGVDFGTAAGLQVDNSGKLHILATQRDATKQIYVNRFSQK